MTLRPSLWLLLGQAVVAVVGLIVLYPRLSSPPPPKVRLHPSYQASRSLPRNHLIEPEDLSHPDRLSKEELADLPKKTDLVARYLISKKQKDEPILARDTRTHPQLDAKPQIVYYFLDLSNQQIPISLLDAETKVELSYCANTSESKKECTPTTRNAEIGAVLCDSSAPKKCVLAIKISRITETELGHSPASEPIRLFLLGQ
jgi:hypothetical protein